MKRYSLNPFPILRTLKTKRLTLRLLRDSRDTVHAANLVATFGSIPLDHRFFKDPLAFEKEGCKKHGVNRYYGYLNGTQPAKAGFMIVIGVMLDRDRHLRVSYELHPDHRGKGYAQEAQQAMIKALEARYPQLSFAAEIEPKNKASRRVLLKSGFRKTGMHMTRYPQGPKTKDQCYKRPSLKALRAG